MEELNHIKKQPAPDGLYQSILKEIEYRRDHLSKLQSMMVLIPICVLSFTSIYLSSSNGNEVKQSDNQNYSQTFQTNELYHE